MSDSSSTTGPLTEHAIRRTFPDYDGEVVAVETDPAEPARRVLAEKHLPSEIAEAVPNDLYTHQAEALDLLRDGHNVTVATSTASGKTWVFGLYMACRFLENENATGVFAYPTKALAKDQQEGLVELYDVLGLDITVGRYDGDTDTDDKQSVRAEANVVLTNFAGLNQYLHHHEKWARIFNNLELVTLDESHTYTGVHGMHVAWIIRRFKRVADGYDADPQWVCSTATVGNAREHTENLIGEETTIVDSDGSPSGERNILFWNPGDPAEVAPHEPEPDADEYGGNTAHRDAAALTAHLALHDVQTLTFTRSRNGAELAAKHAIQSKLAHPDSSRADYIDVEPYHAGLGKRVRHQREHDFKTGGLDAVTSTNALELGIDIGGVDATVLTGYPGDRQSFHQQIGRAGRGTDTALAALVARQEAVDQYVVQHPEYLLDDPVEDAVIDLTNNNVYAPHVLCAADERPLTRDDAAYFGGKDRLADAVEMWRKAGELTGDLENGVRYTGRRPQQRISLYATSGVEFTLNCVDDDEIDHDTVGKERAFRDYHEGALFLHNGEQYRVVELEIDTPQPHIDVERAYTNEYTETLGDTAVKDLQSRTRRVLRPADSPKGEIVLHTGTGTVATHYTAYNRRRIDTGNITRAGVPIELPPITIHTDLLWLTFDERAIEHYLDDWTFDAEPAARDAFGTDGAETPVLPYDRSKPTLEQSETTVDFVTASGLHAAEHAMIKTAPLDLQLSKSNLGGLSTSDHPETEAATLFVYDGIDGGLGFSHRIADNLGTVAGRARDRVANCDCIGGCPACVMDDQCGDGNNALFPQLAESILSDLEVFAAESE
jgi:DEAD/DEAH box helicase domain-containing protein